MVKRFSDYESTNSYGSFQALPKGAYKLIVKGAKVENYRNGDCIKLAVDIAEGDYSGYYGKDFDGQKKDAKKWRGVYLINIPNDDGTERDNKTKRWFKTVMDAFEKSNYGYRWNWDELTLKGKTIAGLFVKREYLGTDGDIRSTTALRRLISIPDFESGNYKMPDDELLERATPSADEFVPVSTSEVSDLPF